jgi:hypothetical protein
MDHIDIVLESNLDNLVTGKVGTNWSVLSAFADNVGLVGFLPVHAKSVFIAVYGDGVEGKFVGGTDCGTSAMPKFFREKCNTDSNRDFSSVGNCTKC